MRATDIAFVKHVGIEEDNAEVSLECRDEVLNHLGTIHASAQFTLAETHSLKALKSPSGESMITLENLSLSSFICFTLSKSCEFIACVMWSIKINHHSL